MNPYSSVLRTLRGRNVYEGVMPTPPADVSIALNAWTPAIFNRVAYTYYDGTGDVPEQTIPFLNVNSNIICKRAGLFSNFADGLVPKTVTPGADFVVRAVAGTRIEPGTVAVPVTTSFDGDPTSKTLTVNAGSTTGIASGSILLFTEGTNQQMPLGAYRAEYGIVDSVVAGTSVTLYDYPKFSHSASRTYIVNPISESAQYVMHLDATELNWMYELDHFFTPLEFSNTGATDIVLLGSVIPEGTMTWLTKSINTAFADDVLFFDLVADFEFTKGAAVAA